ncbi:MAG: diacylglycerol kinase family lipid kinase [Acidobacteriia bacterium]|nr:diacylglycerol kinase family lipid kinase [Terriglobia bacterium]
MLREAAMRERFFAIVNPAAGGGRSAKLAGPALMRLRSAGLSVDVIASTGQGHVMHLAQEAYQQGYRKFLAVGGDGTAHEIINGIFTENPSPGRIALGFLPLGTGNSFLRDFSADGEKAAMDALLAGRSRPCDVIRLTHSTGAVYSFNIISIGFPADVGMTANRYFKRLGTLGYLLGVFARVASLSRRPFPLRCDADKEWDEGRCLFYAFSNSKYTGGTMMIAPQADPTDGLIEVVRWGPIGRLGLIRMLPRLYDGTHVTHPLASRRAARRIEFRLPGPVNVLVDGEVLELDLRSVEVIPAALDCFV